jgi:hypothetical protein
VFINTADGLLWATDGGAALWQLTLGTGTTQTWSQITDR